MINHKPFEGHTPGPFRVEINAYGTVFIYDSAHKLLCGGDDYQTLSKENAELFASSPALLAENLKLRKLVKAQEAYAF